MTHYFFNIIDGTRIEDEEGMDLPDLAAARDEAIRNARSIMADAIWSGRLPLDEVIEIADRRGHVLTTVPFKAAVELPDELHKG
jgi:hypothetical protein